MLFQIGQSFGGNGSWNLSRDVEARAVSKCLDVQYNFQWAVLSTATKAAFFVLEDMCSHRFVPSFASLTKLLKKSLDPGTFEISVQVLELMLRFGYMRSLIVVNRLIAGLVERR